MINMTRPIALLTDFGLKDHYVGSLKGVILKINPKAVIFDISHDVRPQNIREGAFILNSVYSVLPKGTIVVAVVDPGVGSRRQALCVKTSRGFLIAPNNGVLSMVLANERSFETRAIVNERFFHKPVSTTFHGRDIFAPSAAWLSKKDVFRSFGPVVRNIHTLAISKVTRNGRALKGEIIHIDRFGNAITNISKAEHHMPAKVREICVARKGGQRVLLKDFFSAGARGELIAVWNSGNLLEFAVKDDSAEKRYGLKIGDPVAVTYLA